MTEVKSETRRERYRRWFKVYDANGDGGIDEMDYAVTSERLVNARGAGGGTSGAGLIAAVKARFAQIAKADTNGDGKVSEEEYFAAAPQPLGAGQEMDALQDALARRGFASFDMDGDGKLDLKDYVLTHIAFGLNPRLNEVVARFKHWDVNGDGYISLEEFLASYKKHQLSDELMPFYFCTE